jgi:hypothetical protein
MWRKSDGEIREAQSVVGMLVLFAAAVAINALTK